LSVNVRNIADTPLTERFSHPSDRL